MKRELAVSFAAAAICHALLLFAFRPSTAAKPLALSDEGAPVVVDLVQPAAETPSAPPGAAATPEPSSLALFGTGVLSLVGVARRRRYVGAA